MHDLLIPGRDTIVQIEAAIKKYDLNQLRVLFNYPQPKEWVKSAPSDLLDGMFQWNEIQLIEALMNHIFPGWTTDIIQHFITQDKSAFTSSMIVRVSYSISNNIYSQTGVSTSFASTMRHLQLATPLSKSEAKKNAIKEIGIFFGRELSRMDNRVPERDSEKTIALDQEIAEKKKILIKVISGMTQAEAAKYVSVLPDFKYDREIKKIINDKEG